MRSARLLLLLCLLLCSATPATATPTYVTAVDAVPCATCSSLTFPVTVAAGSNLALVVGVAVGSSCTSTPTIPSVTFNGVSMGAARTNSTGTDGGCTSFGRVSQYLLVAPFVGTANVVITLSAAAPSIQATAHVLSSVHQTTPVRSTATAALNATSTTITTTVPSFTVTDLLLDMVCNGNTVSAAGAGQTQRTLRNTGTSTTCNNAGSSTQPGSVDGVMSWTTGLDISLLSALAIEEVATDIIPPTDPTNLVVTATGSSTLALSWTASTDNIAVTNYSVERCLGAACSPATVISSPVPALYDDSGLVASTLYRYRVRATDGTNFSGYSSTEQATTLAVRQATLTWTDTNGPVTNNEDNYVVQRKTGSTGLYADLSPQAAANAVSYVDPTSPTSTTGVSACYRVRATGSGFTDSPQSTEACTAALSVSTAPGISLRGVSSQGVSLR